uniref:Initiator Rep protein WH1 domain-containing protein n=2 Tax=Staphylococcaceae TaxID=90964 RepID=F8WK73_STAAU|nr:hypothetical protein [Staphylococcus aureus]
MTKHHEQTIVQYHTDLNDILFKGFKAVELNLFFAICSLLKDRGSERIILDIDEIKKIAHYTSRSKKRFEPDLMNVIEKVMALPFSEYSQFAGQKMDLFDVKKTKIDFDGKKLSIGLTPRFSYILNHFDKHSVAFPIARLTHLKSIYSKYLYRLFLQYIDEETYTFSIEAFRERLDLKEKYPYMKDMDRRVFKMINNELGAYYDVFKFQKILEQPQRVIKVKYVFYNEII